MHYISQLIKQFGLSFSVFSSFYLLLDLDEIDIQAAADAQHHVWSEISSSVARSGKKQAIFDSDIWLQGGSVVKVGGLKK